MAQNGLRMREHDSLLPTTTVASSSAVVSFGLLWTVAEKNYQHFLHFVCYNWLERTYIFGLGLAGTVRDQQDVP